MQKNDCKKHPQCGLIYKQHGRVRLSGIYRLHTSTREGQKIWIVDGEKVARTLFPDFIMGGNDQRYRFNPPADVWIDNRLGIEEYLYTLAHELIERKLMRERGWSYDRAHGEGLALEKKMRERDKQLSEKREAQLRKHETVIRAGTRRKHRVEPVSLVGVYRQFFGRRQGLNIWIVDGPKVRRDLYPDFCFGTHDYDLPFVPEGEVWLDSAMSVEEAFYALRTQLSERRLMAAGQGYDKAYDETMIATMNERLRQMRLVERHEARLAHVEYGVRERGVKPKSTKRKAKVR